MVGRSADVGESGGEIDTGLSCKYLEGDESLVVVHGKYSVKLTVGTAAEEAVGGIRTERKHTAFVCLGDGGCDDLAFLSADHACVTCVRIEGEDGYARSVDAEILYERAVESHDLVGDGL